jgi:hypothetical protein
VALRQLEFDLRLKAREYWRMSFSRLAPAYASITLFAFLALTRPLIGRDVFFGLSVITLIACMHRFVLAKNSR